MSGRSGAALRIVGLLLSGLRGDGCGLAGAVDGGVPAVQRLRAAAREPVLQRPGELPERVAVGRIRREVAELAGILLQVVELCGALTAQDQLPALGAQHPVRAVLVMDKERCLPVLDDDRRARSLGSVPGQE